MKLRLLCLSLITAFPMMLTSHAQADDDLATLVQELKSGKTTALEIYDQYDARILAGNPALQAVLKLNPQAKSDAMALDKNKGKAGRLAGLPILLKDNIAVRGMVTTAGSTALADNLAASDAPLVARLRASGAIIMGKANLSEWANLRSTQSTSGWSSVGGQTRNPYAPDRSPCGSSSGSGAAVAARLVPAAIGTETDGSIVCPASVNGLVGLKPTVGLVSRTGIVPLSHSQDTAGPMTLTVRDAALVLNAIAGSDKQDPATRLADRRRARDYTAGLSSGALKGKRLGIVRKMVDGYDADTRALFDKSLALLVAQGATVVDQIDLPFQDELDKDELVVLLHEFKADLNTYLASAPAAVKARSMADVIAFNQQHADTVMPYFGQDLMEQAQATGSLQDAVYREASARVKLRAGKMGIDAVLKKYKLDALIAPTTGVAWPIDYKAGDVVTGSSSSPAAIAGYPHLTVPMGLVNGLPVGLSLFAGAWSEAQLLNMGYAFEQARPALPAPTQYIAKPLDRG